MKCARRIPKGFIIQHSVARKEHLKRWAYNRWAHNPKVREWICCDYLDPDERQRRLRDIFGLSAEEMANPATHAQVETDGDSRKSN
jgi:hypothetical protein